MRQAFWCGKRVFITGHTGFKGSWMALWLQRLGAHVTGYALKPPTNPSLFEQALVAEGMTSIFGDIRDQESLRESMKRAQPEIVIHMAAQPLVRYSYQNPVETYSTNIMGTVNLFEAVRETSTVRAVVNITTDKCYENREWIWGYREHDRLGGFDPYSNSKACSELISAAYRSSFFNPIEYYKHGVALATARAGNVIGGGDWAEDRLIPDTIKAFMKEKPVRIRSPHAIRPWQHVLEPIRGYLMLAERLFEEGVQFGEAWNFGPGEEDVKTVGWIVEKLASQWGRGAKWELDEVDHPHEARYLKLDISKARNLLNWQPLLKIDESLNLIVNWEKKAQTNGNIRDICVNQIKSYQKFFEHI